MQPIVPNGNASLVNGKIVDSHRIEDLPDEAELASALDASPR